jgi:hypothetical protein
VEREGVGEKGSGSAEGVDRAGGRGEGREEGEAVEGADREPNGEVDVGAADFAVIPDGGNNSCGGTRG